MSDRIWRWRCGCGQWGSARMHTAIRDADSHAADFGHVVVYWQHGSRAAAEAWRYTHYGPGMKRVDLPDWWRR